MKQMIWIFCLIMIGCGEGDQQERLLSENALVIDVRTAQEFQSGHIQNAVNIPYDVIGSRIQGVTQDKDREIVVYCRSGRRSGIALETLKGMGYQNVRNAGGYETLRKQLGQ